MALLQRSYVPFLYVKRIQIASTAKVTTSLGAPCSSTLLSGGIRHNSTQDRSTKNHGNPLSPPSSSKHRRLSSLPVDYHDHENEDNVGKDMNFNHVETSPSHLSYVADISYPITSHLNIIKSKEDAPSGIWPVYRMMDECGRLRDSNQDGYPTNKNGFHKTSMGTAYSIDQEFSGSTHDIHQLKQKLIHQHPDHIDALKSSFLLQNKSDNTMKSYANTFSSLNEHQSSNANEKNNLLLRAYRIMARLRQMDDILLNAQRQGRVSFYLTCRGEEGIHIGSASALSMDDVVLAQYREQGVFMWRGFTLNQFTNQCMTNDLDLGRGRQMPIHYGSRALNIHTISSPLGTQLPHAVGVAYKMKMDKLERAKEAISIVYFGDGAASTTDFHSALNFAATLKVPMIFFCRNNGYAISTKITEQYASDGIVSRCKGYGMAGIRVDGNDVFAVHAATKAAREYAIENSEPVLIEAISYRQGHHSTSDDSSQYRPSEEVSECECVYDPLKRLEKFLLDEKWIDESSVTSIEKEERQAVLAALEKAERRKGPSIDTMFQDVYSEMPLNLVMQEKSLKRHLIKYPSKHH